MKAMVVYSSKSGNTEKLARALHSCLDAGTELFDIHEAPDPSGFDLICLGFWLQAGGPDSASKAFLEKIDKQAVFLFATHGALPHSDHARNAMKSAASLIPNAEVLGRFTCQGEVNPVALEKIAAKADPPVWLEDAPQAKGHPDEEDFGKIREVLRTVLAEHRIEIGAC